MTSRASVAPDFYRAIYRATAARLRAAQVEIAGRYIAAAEDQKLDLMGRIATIGAMLNEIEAIRL
jgi:hypothetical protein